jgi:hypothetical protein
MVGDVQYCFFECGAVQEMMGTYGVSGPPGGAGDFKMGTRRAVTFVADPDSLCNSSRGC